MDLQGVFGIVGGVISIVVLLGGLLVFFKGSYNKARIEALRQDLFDEKGRNDSLRKQVDEDHKKITLMEGDIDHLKAENSMLKEMVTQRAEVERLTGLFMDSISELMGELKKIRASNVE